MILSDDVIQEIEKLKNDLLKKSENVQARGLFSSSSKESKKDVIQDLNNQFRLILSFVVCEVRGEYLSEKDCDILTGEQNLHVNFSRETMIKALNEILKRDQSYSMMLSVIECRDIVNDEIKTAVAGFVASVSMLFLPITWPTYIFGNIVAALGGVAFLEVRHPGILNAGIDCLALGFANAKSHNFFETIFLHDKLYNDFVKSSEQVVDNTGPKPEL